MPQFTTYWTDLADDTLSDAGKVGITDTGGAYASTNVDGALDEIADGTTLDGRYGPTTSLNINKSGWYIRTNGTASTATATLDRLCFSPIIVPQAGMTFDRIACEVTVVGSAGAVVRMGIFKPNSSGQMVLVLDAGTAATDGSTGVKEITISETLDRGLYFLGAVPQVATATFRTTAATDTPYADGSSAALSGNGSLPVTSGVSGAFAGPYTPSFTTPNALIRTTVRIA